MTTAIEQLQSLFPQEEKKPWYNPRAPVIKKQKERQELHEKCPLCDQLYGWINCRITCADKSSVCLSCAVKKEGGASEIPF